MFTKFPISHELVFFSILLCSLFSCSKESSGDKQDALDASIGDYYFEDGTVSSELEDGKKPIGIVFYVNDDGSHGKILSLFEEYQTWGPVKTLTGANNPDDGIINQRTIESLEEWQDKYPSFAWCASLNDGNLEWFMPAKTELKQIFAGMSGFRWVKSGANESEGEINDWADDFRVFNEGEYQDQRDAFNNRIIAAGGTPIDMSDYGYWASTEYDKDIAWYIYFLNGYTHRSGKITGYFNKVRAIAIF